MIGKRFDRETIETALRMEEGLDDLAHVGEEPEEIALVCLARYLLAVTGLASPRHPPVRMAARRTTAPAPPLFAEAIVSTLRWTA